MDIRQYFDPVDFSQIKKRSERRWKYSIGESIERLIPSLNESNLQDIDIIIYGVPSDNGNPNRGSAMSPDRIREELYQLSHPGKVKIADYGNLKAASIQGTYLAIRDITEYFNELKICTVVIGGSHELGFGICEAFKTDKLFSLSVIDSILDVKRGKETFNSENFLTRVFHSNPDIFEFSLIGYQKHLVSEDFFKQSDAINNHLRLGNLRDDLTQAEPILRNSDALLFDLTAIKYSEAPGTSKINPNGLRSEEACQLARYGGMSNKLKVFGLFEVNSDADKNGLTIRLSAEIIWYFIDGYNNRFDNEINSKDNKLTYRVEVKGIDKPLVFYCCEGTKRWWFEVESVKGEKYIFASSKKNYDVASKNEIPEQWLKYVQKIDNLSK